MAPSQPAGAAPHLRTREALVTQISKFTDVGRAMGAVGFAQLYLDNRNAPTEQAVAPRGGKANLARLSAEIGALETLLLRYRD